jgi:fructose-1,6-bisphosphatase/inositol monophosphatase family enzyme
VISAPQIRIFFVDPIDGTQEFLDRTGEFVVMIGLVHGRPGGGWRDSRPDDAGYFGLVRWVQAAFQFTATTTRRNS